MLTKEQAHEFAADWIQSWNAHDLDEVVKIRCSYSGALGIGLGSAYQPFQGVISRSDENPETQQSRFAKR